MRRAALVLVWVALGARDAAADPTLRLDGGLSAQACPLPDVRDAVRGMLGRDPFADDAAVAVQLATSRTDAGVEATLSRGGDERVLDAPDCEQLAQSIAVALVLLMQDAAPPLQVEEVESPPSVVAAAPRAPAHIDAEVLASGAAAVGRDLSPQLVAGVRIRRGAGSAALELSLEPPDTFDVSATGFVTVSRTAFALSPCAHAGAFGFCAVLTAGWTRGTGAGLIDARSAIAPLAAGGLRVEWARALTPRLSLRAFAEGSAYATTTRYLVDEMPVWASPRVEARAGIGIAARIP
jgi:hypothetical protein